MTLLPSRLTFKRPVKAWLTSLLKNSTAEMAGGALVLLAFFLTLALISYSELDPSFNLATTTAVTNWVGLPGAYAADLLLQLVGLASVLFVLMPLAWGIKLMAHKHLPAPSMRIAGLLASLPALCGLLRWIEAPLIWPIKTGLGGFAGVLVQQTFTGMIGAIATILLLAVWSIITLYIGFGIRLREWREAGTSLRSGLEWCQNGVAALRLRLGGKPAEPAGSKVRAEKRAQSKSKQAGNKEEYDIPLIDMGRKQDPEKKQRVVEAPEPRKKPTPSAQAQSAFDLPVNKGKFQLPPLNILVASDNKVKRPSEASLEQNARLLESVLNDFGVNGEITKVRPGPVVTLYELEPSPGTKSARVIGLADDIARSMSAISARIAVIPGKNAIGIELPNATREMVSLREMCEDGEFSKSESKLAIALGKDIGGSPVVVDLAKMPHLLVAGTTGSGKSVAINTMIMSLLYKLTPEECRFIMIDPKMLELSVYDGIPHLLSPVVTEPGKAIVALKWTVKEMENRYRLMSNLGVRNVDGYNKRIIEAKAKGSELTRTVQTGFDPDTGKPVMEEVPLDMNPMPYIVVIVDEMADLMLVAGKDIESSIQRLAQMARAAGIHLIMATQRPSVDVITGVIKANFPTRISFQVTSRIDSRTILGEQGAETLLGQGDMLYMAGGGRITRVHGPFVSDQEVETVVTFLKAQGEPEYIETITIDEDEALGDLPGMGGGSGDAEEDLYQQAVAIVRRDQKISTSYIQRQLRIGYNRAADMMDRMEREGIVSPPNHAGKRELLDG